MEKYENLFLVNDKNEKLSYFQLNEIVEKIGKLIQARSLVVVLCDNSISAIAIYISCIENKIVPILVSKDIDNDFLKEICNEYHPNYIMKPCEDLESVAKIGHYSICMINDKNVSMNIELALLLLTSGSVSSSKLVRISYENIKENANQITEYLPINRLSRPILALPMEYSYGLSIINTHYFARSTIFITNEKIYSGKFWDFFKKSRCDSFSGVPYAYEILDKFKILRNGNFKYLKYITQAGGALSTEMQKKCYDFCKRNSADLYIMYGQTEATARMTYLEPQYSNIKRGSVGKSVLTGKISLIDENGEEIHTERQVGEIVFFGKNVCLGYANKVDDLNKENENNYILHTGDMGYFDNEKFIYITGRKKRIVKILGYRIELDELEKLIGIKLHIKCAITSENEKIYVFVENISEIDIVLVYLNEKMHFLCSIFEVRYTPYIPLSKNGKVQYSSLKIS